MRTSTPLPASLNGSGNQKLASIFFLTSIFNHSIHSSIAVFYLGPHIHEKWKGRIETWQPRKRQRRRPRRNNWLSHQTQGDGVKVVPLVFARKSFTTG